jgi:hypothetical protein
MGSLLGLHPLFDFGASDHESGPTSDQADEVLGVNDLVGAPT